MKRFAMKKIVVILGCMLVASLASDGRAATVKKKLHNTHSTAGLVTGELESGHASARDRAIGKHCPKSDIKLLKCESDGDWLPYQHPADGDGPWWYGPYKAGE